MKDILYLVIVFISCAGEIKIFIFLQRSHALSTIDGYSGYGAEQGEKVIKVFLILLLFNHAFLKKLSVSTG